MAEVVGRRFARMARVTADEFDASFVAAEPGRDRRRQGQLGGALKAMAEH
jgi:hypothetical protein